MVTIWALIVEVVTLGLYAWKGARFARESAAGPIGTGFLLGMLGFAILWLVQLPFTVVELWWLKDHDVVTVGYPEALLDDFLSLGGTFLSICAALLIAMGLARLLRAAWWIPAAAAFVGIMALLTFSGTALLPGLHDPPAWAQRDVDQLTRIEGVDRHIPLRVMDVRDHTSQPNAFATGLGATQRVVLFDTLAEDFPRAQVRVTLAHEVGHLARRHLAKGIGWFALTILPTALVIALVTRRRGGMGEASRRPAGGVRLRDRQPAVDAAQRGCHPPLRGRGRLDGAERHQGPAGDAGPVRQLHPQGAVRPRPARLVARPLRRPPLGQGARADGARLGALHGG